LKVLVKKLRCEITTNNNNNMWALHFLHYGNVNASLICVYLHNWKTTVRTILLRHSVSPLELCWQSVWLQSKERSLRSQIKSYANLLDPEKFYVHIKAL